MLELYLRNSELCDFQERTLDHLKDEVSTHFYYAGSRDIVRVEEVDSSGTCLRQLSPIELLELEFEIDVLVQEKHKSDAHFDGMIQAAKEAVSRL